MPYVNPVPAIDAGKEFEFRLALKFDHLTEVGAAKEACARYILQQSPETIAGWLACTKTKALYPSDLTREELDALQGAGKN